MSNVPPHFSSQLTALDQPSPAAKANHDRAVAALFERKLTPADIARLTFMFLSGLTGAILAGSLALTEPASTPPATRLALGIVATIALSWTALAGIIFRRGSLNSSIHGTTAATMAFAYTLLLNIAIGLLFLFSPNPTPPALLLIPLALLAFAAVIFLLHHHRQSELRLRQDHLQTQYQLALLAESTAPTSRA